MVRRVFKFKISNKQLSEIMYALIKTQAVLESTHSLGIQNYSRKQCKGFNVTAIINVPIINITLFETLTNIKLITLEEFQGKQQIN